MTIERIDPPIAADERATLVGFLDYQRATLRWKCDGLTPEQLLTRSAPPSTLCLLGLVRHLADVEYGWLDHHFQGGPREYYYDYSEDPDADLNVREADEASVAEAWRTYSAQIEKSNAMIAAHELDETAKGVRKDGSQMSLRWILAHLIEEYARHNGHADLLREAIDGVTGE